ncbi:MAG: sel1 repeat family protein, partial [Comamonas sp.]|nr:sel1 repeat family protein [Comamonas sp.]
MRVPVPEMPESESPALPTSAMRAVPSRLTQACLLAAALALGAVSPAMAKGKTAGHDKAAAHAAKSGKTAAGGKTAKSTGGGKAAAKSSGKKGGRGGRAAHVAAGAAAAAAPMGLEHWTPSSDKPDQAEDAKELAALRSTAQSGDAKAQYLLGSRYRFGRGVNQDLAQAVQWFRKSADQGYAPAQSDLGVLYANGRGVSQDERQAV